MAVNDGLGAFEGALLANDRREARRLFEGGAGATPALGRVELLVMPALDRIGRAWEEGEIALSQVYLAGKICEELCLEAEGELGIARAEGPRLAVAVFEDYHMLGKRMVLSALRAEGFAPSDWGRQTRRGILERLRSEPVDVLLLSCLMLHSALGIGELRPLLARDLPSLRLVVGGAPFRLDPGLWKEVGADAGGGLASDAGPLVRSLRGDRP